MIEYSDHFVIVCEVCGNPMPSIAVFCPYCKNRQDEQRKLKGKPRYSTTTKAFRQKVVNIEHGLPFLEVALKRLDRAVEMAQREGVIVLTLIHGYGSSGKGGIIGEEVRKMLDYMQGRGEVRSFLVGEEFGRKNGVARDLVRRYPALAKDRNYNKGNRGITLVIL